MKEKFDLLVQKITQDHDSNEILEAKRDYQKLAGEIYEDDKSYEARMGLFLEWFIFDRTIPGKGETPLEILIRKSDDHGLPDELKNVKKFAENFHGLFVVKKIRDGEVVVLNLLDDKKYNVIELEGKLLFQKNDLFEGRIVFLEGKYFFTGNFCFHPREVEKFIKGEIKKINFVREGYLKQLKKYNSQLKDFDSKLDKNAGEIEKLEVKNQKSTSPDKSQLLKEKIEELKNARAGFVQQKSTMEAEKEILEVQNIKREINELSNQLLQRLSYMNIKWERSRQIDLHDIYCN